MITEEQILQAEEKLLRSIKESDVQQLDKLLHNDLLFILPTGEIITKDLDLQAYGSGKMKIREINCRDQTINIIGDSAVVSVMIRLKGEAFGQPIEGEFRYLRIWKILDQDLKVIAGSCVKV